MMTELPLYRTDDFIYNNNYRISNDVIIRVIINRFYLKLNMELHEILRNEVKSIEQF